MTGAALTALLLVSIEAHAFKFTPTEAEWATWPEMCKARYSRTRIGTGSDFGASVPQSVVQQWEAQLGPGWNYVHHHCAGMIYLDRAKLESNPSQRKFLLGQLDLRTQLRARAHACRQSAGRRDPHAYGPDLSRGRRPPQGAEQFDAALKVNAAYGSAYVGMAMLDRDENHVDAAIATLRKGNEVTSGQSAEISHFLSLLLLQQGHYEESRTFARQAYANGYPLPGLRDRLARPDIRWIDGSSFPSRRGRHASRARISASPFATAARRYAARRTHSSTNVGCIARWPARRAGWRRERDRQQSATRLPRCSICTWRVAMRSLDSLAGAFAFCIVDLERGRTLAAADRMGIWRLHYLHDRGRLLVSTSLDALVRECDTRPAVDIQALYDYVYFHMIPAPRTIYAGVRTLAPRGAAERRAGPRLDATVLASDVANGRGRYAAGPSRDPRAAVAGRRALAVCGRRHRVLPERRPRQLQRGRHGGEAPRPAADARVFDRLRRAGLRRNGVRTRGSRSVPARLASARAHGRRDGPDAPRSRGRLRSAVRQLLGARRLPLRTHGARARLPAHARRRRRRRDLWLAIRAMRSNCCSSASRAGRPGCGREWSPR